MKFRTDFVTNSSSSSFVYIHFKNYSLERILNKYFVPITHNEDGTASLEIWFEGGNIGQISMLRDEDFIPWLCSFFKNKNIQSKLGSKFTNVVDELTAKKSALNLKPFNVELGNVVSDDDGSYYCFAAFDGNTFTSGSLCEDDWDYKTEGEPLYEALSGNTQKLQKKIIDSGNAQTRIVEKPQKPSNSIPKTEVTVDNHSGTSLLDKVCCLTGDFAYGNKKSVEALIIQNGGICAASVTKKTNILIIGALGSAAWAYGSYGTKYEKAQQLKDDGAPIDIFTEEQFFSRLKNGGFQKSEMISAEEKKAAPVKPKTDDIENEYIEAEGIRFKIEPDSAFKISKTGILQKYYGKAEAFVIPKNAREYTARAVSKKSGVRALYFPKGTEINKYDLGELCEWGVEYVAAAEDHESYASKDGVLYNKDFTEIIWCPGEIKKINLPVGLTKIGSNAFTKIKHLRELIIPDGVETIFDTAFNDAVGLERISLPASSKEIGWWCFNGCYNLKELTVAASNPYFCSVDNCLIDREDQSLLFGCKGQNIPSDGSVKEIRCVYGFYGTEEIIIPKSVTLVEKRAFRNCIDIKKLYVENGNARYHSFGNCIIETETKVLITGIVDAAIPDDGSVTSIAPWAFYSCPGLQEITIPDAVTYIGVAAFADCSSLKKVKLPNGLKMIAEETFRKTALESVIIPDGVEIIGGGAFYSCYSLKNITIPASVKEIWKTNITSIKAFEKCKNLEHVYVKKNSYAHIYAEKNKLPVSFI